jgi:CheY-like chemotaxis protein
MGNTEFEGEPLKSRKILVVEDSCDLREILGKLFASMGWDAILAESGREALATLEREIPKIILLDMRMPGMNGFELATTLKKHQVYRKIPILAATAFPDHIARQQCLAAGCDDFISKPFSFAALQASLANLVSGERTEAIEQRPYESSIQAETGSECRLPGQR